MREPSEDPTEGEEGLDGGLVQEAGHHLVRVRHQREQELQVVYYVLQVRPQCIFIRVINSYVLDKNGNGEWKDIECETKTISPT